MRAGWWSSLAIAARKGGDALDEAGFGRRGWWRMKSLMRKLRASSRNEVVSNVATLDASLPAGDG
jgi:hypothetical protein